MHVRPLSARALVALAVLCLAAAPTAAAAAAETYTIDKGHSEGAFQVRHLMTQVRGRFEDFAGTVVMDLDNLAGSSVEFKVKASSINTFNPDRDQHLRGPDFFWVEKYPEVVFKSSKIQKSGENAFDVTGTLQLRGVSKEITLPVTLLGKQKDPWGNTVAGFSAATVIDRKEYGFNWNKALDQGGMLLGDEVHLTFSLETKLQKPAAGK